jgi:hypothetical protein
MDQVGLMVKPAQLGRLVLLGQSGRLEEEDEQGQLGLLEKLVFKV